MFLTPDRKKEYTIVKKNWLENLNQICSPDIICLFIVFYLFFFGPENQKKLCSPAKMFLSIHFNSFQFSSKKKCSPVTIFLFIFFSLAGEHKEICSPAKTFSSILLDNFFFDWRSNKICVLRPKFCNSFILLVGDFFFHSFLSGEQKKCSPAESHFIYSFFLFIFFWAGEQKKSCSPAKFF